MKIAVAARGHIVYHEIRADCRRSLNGNKWRLRYERAERIHTH